MRPLATLIFFALSTGPALAQTDDSTVAFEAASIKPFVEGTPRAMSGCLGGPGSDDPGQIHCEYVSLRMLVMRAYSVRSQEIFGPAWLDSEHFNLLAKLPQGAKKEQVPAMFRNLLTERFKLALHHEDRLLPAYSLTVGKSGSKLKEATDAPPPADEPPPGGKLPTGKDGFPILRTATYAGATVILYRQGRARLQGGKVKLASLAASLTHQLDRVVTDDTGLSGMYDITLYWVPDATEPGGGQRPVGATPEASTPDVDLLAALEQQLGLKLVSKKISRDSLVIDRAEKVPTEN